MSSAVLTFLISLIIKNLLVLLSHLLRASMFRRIQLVVAIPHDIILEVTEDLL